MTVSIIYYLLVFNLEDINLEIFNLEDIPVLKLEKSKS